uniref:Uncharacterized protein n=1 Tax=Rousettus aegyptiacus TaxID=9407 RepID=A0A7J8CIS0_ROUAE|nr:hypothetical protein HJG63_009189 [Rousettus aegyptiacus]
MKSHRNEAVHSAPHSAQSPRLPLPRHRGRFCCPCWRGPPRCRCYSHLMGVAGPCSPLLFAIARPSQGPDPGISIAGQQLEHPTQHPGPQHRPGGGAGFVAVSRGGSGEGFAAEGDQRGGTRPSLRALPPLLGLLLGP